MCAGPLAWPGSLPPGQTDTAILESSGQSSRREGGREGGGREEERGGMLDTRRRTVILVEKRVHLCRLLHLHQTGRP